MKSTLLTGTAALALLLGATAPSHATLELQLSDGVNPTIQIIDNGAGDLANLLLGDILFNETIGNFTINSGTGLAPPNTTALLDLNSIDVTSANGGGTLTLKLTDTNLTGPTGLLEFLGHIGGTIDAGTTLTAQSLVDCSNSAFGGTQTTSQSFTNATTGTIGFSGGAAGPGGPCLGSLYSVTEVITLAMGPSSTSSFDYNLRVPEPGSLALLGAGLVGFGWFARRRRKSA